MDAKITKRRLNIFLSYDWIKILLMIAAAILVWSLVFTTAATRLTSAQNFTIFNYTGTTANNGFSRYSEVLEKNGVFSYDVLEITATDLNAGKEYSSQILQARLATNEGDAVFAANVGSESNGSYTDENGETQYYTYLESFLYNYSYGAATFGEGGYLDQLKAYLNDYYYNDYESGVANEEKILSDFRARIKKLKDKRFKTAEKLAQGEKDELARVESYRTALLEFEAYLGKGYVALQETTLRYADEQGNVTEKTEFYSVNLCPDETTMGSLANDVFYTVSRIDESGAEKQVPSAKDINLVLLDISKPDHRYSLWEGLDFINYLVRTHCSDKEGVEEILSGIYA